MTNFYYETNPEIAKKYQLIYTKTSLIFDKMYNSEFNP